MGGERIVGRSAPGLAVALVVSMVTAAALVVPAGSASADSTSVPGSLSTVAQQTGPLSIMIPPGTTPSAVTGVLSMPAVVDGSTISILVNGRTALTVPSTLYTKVIVPVLPTDIVAGGTLALALAYAAPPGAAGCQPDPPLTLRKLALDYTGTETPPATLAEFFPADAARIDVQVDRGAGDDVLQAALNAVAALSERYPIDTPVVLSASDTPLPTVGAGQRIVRIVGTDGPVSAALDTTGPVPTLVLSGAGLPLSDVARTLGAGEPVPADGVTAPELPDQTEPPDEGLTRSLAQLQAASPDVETSATGTELVEIRQDSFGTPTSSLKVHLEGTHSAVPTTAAARLDVYLDDRLVSSQVIGTDPAIDLDFIIPGPLRSTGELQVTVHSAADATQPCSPVLPLELSLDTEKSTVTATAGLGSTSGFQLFPQVFDGRLPVAIRQDGSARLDGAVDAATLIANLQRQGAAPLAVTIVDPDTFLEGDRSGLVVGAGYADSVAFNAPLRLAGNRLPESAQARFRVSATAPFAALEVIGQRDRHVLMLGSWAPGDAGDAGDVGDPVLSHRLVDRVTDVGWHALDDDVMVAATGSGPPFTVDSGVPPSSADPADTDASHTAYAAYAAAAAIFLVLLIALRVVLAVRRRYGRRARRRQEPIVVPPDDQWDGDDDDDTAAYDAEADVSDRLEHRRQPLIDLRRGRPRP